MVTTIRKIIHVDMDAFYASIEQRDHPEYRGKPVAVGGSPEGRGVVAAASYEARKFGIRSAMSSKRAMQLCPHVIFVRPRFDVYSQTSRLIREIFSRYTDMIEPLSLDEAYLDVTSDKMGIGSALDIAKQIKEAIRNELHLTASAGVSINKFVAKIASDMDKPDGLTFIGPSKVQSFMEKLPVEKFHGVGKVTAEKMKKLGLHTGADIKRLKETELVKHFGKPGKFFYKIVRGIDDREVVSERETKSVGAEDTFITDLIHLTDMNVELEKLAEVVSDRMQRHHLKGRTLTVKIKYHDFKLSTRSKSFNDPIGDGEAIAVIACQLLAESWEVDKRVRLLGISLSNFDEQASRPRKEDSSDQLKIW